MSMIKIITPGAQDFSEPVASLIKISNRGLVGVDLSAFEKRAGAPLAHEVAKLARGLESDEPLIHLLAVGATEDYGANRNGDGFRRTICREYHPTFKKHARFYRDHKNKNKAKSYGQVKYSVFHEPMKRVELVVSLNGSKEAARRNKGLFADREMQKLAEGKDIGVSMACFPPGTLVRLDDDSEVPIEQVSLGSRVRTHTGAVCKVDQRHTVDYDGDLVGIRAVGLPDELLATPDHSVWLRPTLRGKSPTCPVCSGQFKSLRSHLWQKKDPQHQLAYRDYERYAEGWYPAAQLVPGDYVRTPFDTTIDGAGDANFARLLGYYLAEGNVVQRRSVVEGVDFSFAVEEDKYVAEVLELAAALGYPGGRVYIRNKTNNHPNGSVKLVRILNVELANRLHEAGGSYSHAKRISPAIMQWSPTMQMEIVSRWIHGDGCWNRVRKSLSATTVSRTLAWQLATILWRNNIPARITSDTTYRKRKRRRPYVVEVPPSHLEQVPSDCVPASYKYTGDVPRVRDISHLKYQSATAVSKPYTATKLQCYVDAGFVYRRIRQVRRVAYTGPVHNVAVAVDGSYTVHGVAVKNCRVSHDICSFCGNKAPSRQQYCESTENGGHCKAGGLKDNIGSLVEIDGGIHHLHADNPDPTFFDISHVYRPADRIAYTMGMLKAAGHDTMGGAELAEVLGVTLPYELLIDETQPGAAQRMLKLAYQLAGMEADIQTRGQSPHQGFAGAFTESVQATDIPSPPLYREKIGQTLRALADARISLPVDRFLELVAGQDREKAASMAEIVQRELPGIYSRLLARGNLPEQVAATPFIPGPAASPEFRLWAEKQASALSIEEVHVRRRVTQAALRGVDVFHVDSLAGAEKLAADRGPVARLAEEYALYKLAFLGSIPESDTKMQLTASMALLQNYIL